MSLSHDLNRLFTQPKGKGRSRPTSRLFLISADSTEHEITRTFEGKRTIYWLHGCSTSILGDLRSNAGDRIVRRRG